MLQSVKISELPSADTLTEDDLLVIDQPDDTKKATLFQVASKLGPAILETLELPSGASMVGTSSGKSVQEVLDVLDLNTIARIFSIDISNVSYLIPGMTLENYTLVYNTQTKTCFWVGGNTGVVESYELAEDSRLKVTLSNGDVRYLNSARLVAGSMNQVWVEDFSNLNTTPADWGPAFRAAVMYAYVTQIYNVWFQGSYNISSVGSTWVLPFDDGTVSPDRITAGTESNLPSEPQISVPVHIDLPYGVNINSTDIWLNRLTFTWDGSSANTNLPIAFVGRVNNWDGTYVAANGASNRYSSKTVKNQLSGFAIYNAFIGYVADGVAQWLNWPSLRFNNVGMCFLSAGMDHCEFGYIHLSNTVAGFLSGGWWQTRNAGNYPQSKLPPYPAPDVQAAGWNDFVYFNSIMDEGRKEKWTEDSVYPKVDEYFDQYIYKTRHSVKVADGGTGRMTLQTNAGADAYAATEADPFRGVAGRTLYFMSRGMHYNKCLFIDHLKVHGRHRIPICLTSYQTITWAGALNSCYIERAPFTDTTLTSASGNDFYTSPLNKYNTTWPYGNASRIELFTTAPASAVQGKMAVKLFCPSNALISKSSSDGADITSVQSRQTVFSPTLTAATQTPIHQVGIQTPSAYSTIYSLWRGMQFMQPLSWKDTNYLTRDTEEVLFEGIAYKNSKTPITSVANGVTDGSANVALGGNSFLSYIRTRNQVEAKYFLQIPGATGGYTASMFIPMDGLPIPLTTVSSGVLGNTVPEVSMARASYRDTTSPWRTVSFTLGSDGKYYLSLNKDYYGSSKGALSELVAGSYLVFTVRYTTVG